MDLDSLQRIGRLGKPWGHQGDLTVQLEGVELEDLSGAECLFADIDGQKVPFFIAKLRDKGRDVLVKFDEFHDPQSAAILVGRDIYAPPGLLVEDDEEHWDPATLIGMQVADEAHGELGEVVALDGTDEHPVLVIRNGGEEVLVPLADELVVGIDAAQGLLVVRTPPGLLELYRGA
jgi:16S rRNA processing protein RimM